MKIKDYHNNITFEWIPYSQFVNINEISSGDFAIIYSAIWKDGPLYYNQCESMRKSNKKSL